MKVYAKRGLYERFQRALTKLHWKPVGEKVLLGLSGGRDSVTLLHLLLVRGHRVVAAHLNHQLRGRESLADENFVRQLCKQWNVPLFIKREKVLSHAKTNKLSVEEASRIARYRFLAALAQKQKINQVVVAHHQHDQAETVLLKIFMGIHGRPLYGMKMQRPLPILNWNKSLTAHKKTKIQLIRPLLEAPREEIILYTRQNHLPFRQDSSNKNLSYPRNWIRLRLIPLIERRLNRNIIKTLARIGSN